MTDNIRRRSVRERMAERQLPIVDSTLVPLLDEPGSTSTFRIGATGELMLDTAASLPMAEDRDQSMGALAEDIAAAYHLLALPEDASADEVEALAVSVWDEAGWQHPGVLHLTQGVTLEGPWDLPPQALGLDYSRVFLLRAEPRRGAAPAPGMENIDLWARAFPEGVPVGAEFEALLALRRIARRLGGQLRLAGKGIVLTQDPFSAVDLNVFGDTYLQVDEVGSALHDMFPGRVQLATPEPELGQPYALMLRATDRSTVLVGVSPTELTPRALRWEPNPRYLYELRWNEANQFLLPDGQISRVGQAERRRVAEVLGAAAVKIRSLLGAGAIIDEDDFLLDPAELPPAPEAPRP